MRTSRSWMCRRKSSETKSFWICQSRLGKKISSEIATPSHSHLLRKRAQRSVKSTPPTMANAQTTMLYFVSMPKPMQPPIASHHRGSRDLHSRTKKYEQAPHARQSNEPYCKRFPAPRAKGTAADAASACAPVLPPSARAINPVKTTATDTDTAAKNRKPVKDAPNSLSDIHPKNGVTGGYAT